jgi:hypothetical protein
LLVIGLVLGKVGLSSGQGVVFDDLTRPSQAKRFRVSSANPDLKKNNDARTIEAGQTLVLAEIDGPAVIKHIWCTIGSADPFIGRKLVLRMEWDGSGLASVEVPIGDFFGVGHGAWRSFSSLPVSTSSLGRSKNGYWSMPFRKRAKITVANESDRSVTFYYYIDGEKRESLAEDTLYFHARYRQEHPARPGDYLLLETAGHGHYVGTVLSVLHTQLGWFGEGDDRFWIDGESEPSIRGTGTEDYFGDAWGFREFAHPMNGVSLWEGNFPGDRGTAYRWHLTDPILFKRSLRVAMEHRGSIFARTGLPKANFEERPDWMSSVAFWYQMPPAGSSSPLPGVSDRLAPYRLLPIKSLVHRAEPAIVLLKNEDGINYIPRKKDAWLEIDFDVPQEGMYRVDVVVNRGLLYSKYQPLIDGKLAGEILDLGGEGIDPEYVSLDRHAWKSGKHTLRFKGRGPSSKARSTAPEYFGLTINAIVLLRLEDLAGYQE